MWPPNEPMMVNEAKNTSLRLESELCCRNAGIPGAKSKFSRQNEFISPPDRLLTLQRSAFLRASSALRFCLIFRISLAPKTNSSVMESSLMKALGFAGFRHCSGSQGGSGRETGRGTLTQPNCERGMQADSRGGVPVGGMNQNQHELAL